MTTTLFIANGYDKYRPPTNTEVFCLPQNQFLQKHCKAYEVKSNENINLILSFKSVFYFVGLKSRCFANCLETLPSPIQTSAGTAKVKHYSLMQFPQIFCLGHHITHPKSALSYDHFIAIGIRSMVTRVNIVAWVSQDTPTKQASHMSIKWRRG